MADDNKGPWDNLGEVNKPRPKPKIVQPNKGDTKKDPIEDLIYTIFNNKFRKKSSGPKNTKAFNRFSIILLLILGGAFWLISGFYLVQEGEVAVVMRFGKMVRITGAGWSYHLPTPIERVIVKELMAVNKIDSMIKGQGDIHDQSLILTGDENMVFTNYTVFWKIKDIAEFLFTTRNPEATIRVAAESALREIFGQTTARLTLTEGREDIANKTQELLQKILDQYKMGVQIINVQLQRVEPPAQVIETFNDMQASLVDADRSRNEAEAYRNDILPRARGEAAKIIQEAEGYKQQVVAKVEGEVSRFAAIAKAADVNQEITTTRYYLETIEKILKGSKKTFIDSKVGNGVMPYYNLQTPNKEAKVSP